MNYRNVSDLNQTILQQLYRIPRDFDLIVGIPRSGMLPANLLALYLNRPYTDLYSFLNGHVYKAGARGQFFDIQQFRKVLVVDDSIASGAALEKAREQLREMAARFEIRYAVVYAIAEKQHLVDYALDIVPLPRYFQWNILNHTILSKACFDIDGVLCVDPTPEQNDDGSRYREFLRTAQPLFVPGSPIGTLVTSRLEKYRPETEQWLAEHGVRYNKLVMLDLPDMAARAKANRHGSFKAEEYQKSQYALFVESELRQAIDINRLTGKPVLCTATFEMIFESQSLFYNIKSGQRLPWLRKCLLALRNRLR